MTVPVVAVVPTYRPDADGLQQLLESLAATGTPALVSDDASPGGFPAHLRLPEGCRLTRHHENRGIARGLNDGLAHAIELGAQWLLTVDQDTVLPDGYIERLLDQAAVAVAVLGPRRIGAVGAGEVADASGPMRYPVMWQAGLPMTLELIQTGTLWSVDGLREIGGFDERLGIDAVDAAACVRLRAAGHAVLVAPAARIEHRIGSARQFRVLGRTVMATGHSPARRETMMRNRLRLAPEEFKQSPRQAFRTLRRLGVSTVLAVTVEDHRWAKALGSARGVIGAFRPLPDPPPSDRFGAGPAHEGDTA
jgi:rhamnosyltransferase